MADTAAAPAPAPAETTVASPVSPVASRGAARMQRREAAMARVRSVVGGEGLAAAAPASANTAVAASAANAVVAAGTPTADKPPAAPEKPDPTTDRGLRAVEQARKKFLDEQNAAKAELEVQRAEIARLRKEAEGRVASKEELKKLSPTDLLEALDHYTEDDLDILSRTAYARTKAGKADPRAQAAAQEAARAQGGRAAATKLEQKYAELEARYAELEKSVKGEFTRRDQVSFAERWVGEAVKAIPADKPTFLSKLYANEPDTARRELLVIGAELEKANDGEPPTQAEVIEEFEKRKRAQLKSLGLDADALLAPPKPKPAPAPAARNAARTLDVTAPSMTRPENAPKTREERRQLAYAHLRDQKRMTADQQ